MYLLIDITPREGFNLVYFEPDKTGTFFVDEKYFPENTDRLLSAIKEFVSEQGTEVKKLKGLAMSSGGSFTATRTAGVMVNTIGQIHNIPVAFIPAGDLISGAYQALARQKGFRPIVPGYAREPNITKTKKKVQYE